MLPPDPFFPKIREEFCFTDGDIDRLHSPSDVTLDDLAYVCKHTDTLICLCDKVRWFKTKICKKIEQWQQNTEMDFQEMAVIEEQSTMVRNFAKSLWQNIVQCNFCVCMLGIIACHDLPSRGVGCVNGLKCGRTGVCDCGFWYRWTKDLIYILNIWEAQLGYEGACALGGWVAGLEKARVKVEYQGRGID